MHDRAHRCSICEQAKPRGEFPAGTAYYVDRDKWVCSACKLSNLKAKEPFKPPETPVPPRSNVDAPNNADLPRDENPMLPREMASGRLPHRAPAVLQPAARGVAPGAVLPGIGAGAPVPAAVPAAVPAPAPVAPVAVPGSTS